MIVVKQFTSSIDNLKRKQFPSCLKDIL